MLTKSKSQTQKFAAKLAKKILRKGTGRKASILALSGDLGAGKTTFTQGFIKALGVKHHVTSPTFLIVRRYPLGSLKSKVESRKFLNAYHFDLYRIHSVGELISLNFKKILNDPQNIVLLEWPERIGKSLPKSAHWIRFEHGKKQKERIIKVKF